MASTLSDSPRQNRILGALSTVEYARPLDDLELVFVQLGQKLYEPGDNLDYVYFPTTSTVSLMFTTQNGASAELAMTGNDGLVGVPLVLGGDTTTYCAVVQSAGKAYRLRAEVMRWELDQGGELQHLCLHYAQALMTQMAQSVVCNRHHSVDQQLCRWLLLSLDRQAGNQLNITQERIAATLGVRREGVTEAAGKLQAAGLIEYSRGHITVRDRAGIETRVCECYAVVKAEHERLYRLMPDLPTTYQPRTNPATLRQRAEAHFLQNKPVTPNTRWDKARLLYELQVHEIELEMQNEELRSAYAQADALRARYADIYDFAPLSYFTLDPAGTIIDLNLAGAILLGIKRSQKNRHRFSASVAPEYCSTFTRFVDNVLQSKAKHICEIALLPTGQRAETLVRIEAVPDEAGRECRMIVIDVFAEKRAGSSSGAEQRAALEKRRAIGLLIDSMPT